MVHVKYYAQLVHCQERPLTKLDIVISFSDHDSTFIFVLIWYQFMLENNQHMEIPLEQRGWRVMNLQLGNIVKSTKQRLRGPLLLIFLKPIPLIHMEHFLKWMLGKILEYQAAQAPPCLIRIEQTKVGMNLWGACLMWMTQVIWCSRRHT